ncbi:hypothetical protein BDW68DRAFT_195541 [Aspergillus falconensis]
MADPLSVAAGIAGLLSLGIQVSEALCKFYASYKGQSTEIARTVDKLGNLSIIFRSIENALQSRPSDNLTKTIYHSIDSCADIIIELQEEYKSFKAQLPGGIKGKIKAPSRRVAYPFRKSTFQKLDEDIQEIRDNISVALDALHLGEQKKLHDYITEVKLLLEHIQAGHISSRLRDWLQAPDATTNHNAACAKRHAGTGLWFMRSYYFMNWTSESNSFLWLNGFAGCGKSVLCSTIIQHTFGQHHNQADVGIAFFYFEFSDESKQDESGMIRALLLQLAGQRQECQTDITHLHKSYTYGIPPVGVLLEQLRCTIQRFQHVYIFVDALDESPRHDKRDRVLETVGNMRGWRLPSLHLLVTSRDEFDIRRSLNPGTDEDMILKNDEHDGDIENFISSQLKTNQHLQKWQAFHDEIQQALSERAQGVFRYVECQFRDLRRCPRTKSHLYRCLQSLPRNLDETYERMLCNIDETCIKDAQRILTILCFSSRPLIAAELIDACAVDLSEPFRLEHEARQLDEEGFLEICPGLIEVIRPQNSEGEPGQSVVRIAHFSVLEYLVSERIRQQKAAKFNLRAMESHRNIACICLAYLLEPGLSKANDPKIEYPLASYAGRYWVWHYRQSRECCVLSQLVLKLFKHSRSFTTWIRLSNPDLLGFQKDDSDIIPSALYYACLFGLLQPAEHLLQSGTDINVSGGRHGKPLIAASWEGHDTLVELLLEKGADVNVKGGQYGTALQSACFWGYEFIVFRLLENGADINCACGHYGSALQAASFRGHKRIVEELLRRGANVDAEGGDYGTPLQAASSGGHLAVVDLLLAFGASVNLQKGRYESAIQAALWKGHGSIADLLRAKGAAPKSQTTSFLEWDHDYTFQLR